MDLHDRLEEIFQDVFDDEKLCITDATSAADIEDWDSIANINLMVAIEQGFGVRFRGNELGEFRNVGELKRFLEEQGRV